MDEGVFKETNLSFPAVSYHFCLHPRHESRQKGELIIPKSNGSQSRKQRFLSGCPGGSPHQSRAPTHALGVPTVQFDPQHHPPNIPVALHFWHAVLTLLRHRHALRYWVRGDAIASIPGRREQPFVSVRCRFLTGSPCRFWAGAVLSGLSRHTLGGPGILQI